MGRPRRPIFSPLLAAHRRDLGLTQEQVAERLVLLAREHDNEELPATAHIVARHERADHYPSLIYRRQYVRLYKVSEEQLGLLIPSAGLTVTDTGRDSSADSATDDPLQRRDVLRLGTAATISLLGGQAISASPLAGIARALTTYSAAADSAPSVVNLRGAVAKVKSAYQACRYHATIDALPGALDVVRATCSSADGDDLLLAYALGADVYQVAASIFLKFDDTGLAAIAADRSMDAATRSQNPVAVAASARAITHALMTGGHPARAAEVSTQAATALDHEELQPDDDSLSVYGALVLRGAIAAARAENRAAAFGLLDEADNAARRLGHDDNAHWTAFGPTNVLLHRVNVALVLGDAGTALDYASRVELDRIPIAERKASLFVDAAQALTQWGKYERAFDAIRTADSIAPEEVRSRGAVRTILSDIAARSPRFVGPRVREFLATMETPA